MTEVSERQHRGADAAALARFWADVLGWRVAEDSNSGQAVLLAGDGDPSAPRIVFNKMPEPKTVKNRLHLDLVSGTFDAETARLLRLPNGSATCRQTRPAGRPSPTSRATSST